MMEATVHLPGTALVGDCGTIRAISPLQMELGTPLVVAPSGVTVVNECEECEQQRATVECEDCGLSYCAACDRHRHRKGKLVFHQRQPRKASPQDSSQSGSASPEEENESPDAKPSPRSAALAARPTDTSSWTTEEVAQWLRDHELGVFLADASVHGLDGAFLLSSRMDSFLEAQSTASRGQKKKLLREIHKLQLRVAAAATEASVPSSTTETMACGPQLLSASTERSGSLHNRMGVNLRVTVDMPSTSSSASPSSMVASANAHSIVHSPQARFSPVAAHRARVTHGQQDDLRGRVQGRKSWRQCEPLQLAQDEAEERAATPVIRANTSESRRGLGLGLALGPGLGVPPPLHIEMSAVPHHVKEDTRDARASGSPRDLRSARHALGGLDLDMVTVKKDARRVEASFDFSAEGRLQTQGFEIRPDGIANTPFAPPRHRSADDDALHTSARAGTSHQHTGGGSCARQHLLLLHELGHGAGGKVYKALYLPTFKLVAIKVIRAYDQKKRHQMVRELKSLYANFVPITAKPEERAACDDLVVFYDAFTNPEVGSVSIVLEYMDGGSLEDGMQAGRYRTESELATVASCALRGLAFLHERHQLHRDIKLSNMLVNHRGQVKISDFGISRDLESTLAKATTFTGTLLYMAPERISGGTYSYPSDIWSFGLALMACATGKLAVPTKEGYWGVVHAVQEQPSPSLRTFGDQYSPELCDFLDQCLQKNPMARPSAAELLQHAFIKHHGSPSQALNDDNKVLTPEQRDTQLKALEEIADLVETWYGDPTNATTVAELLVSSSIRQGNQERDDDRRGSSAMPVVSHQERIRNLATQMRLPEDVVAARFAFMKSI